MCIFRKNAILFYSQVNLYIDEPLLLILITVTEISFDSDPSHSLVLFTRPEAGHP